MTAAFRSATFLLCLFCSFALEARETSFAALSLVGYVPPTVSVGFQQAKSTVSGKIEISSEQLRRGFSEVPVGTVNEITNDPSNDYEVQLLSANNGKVVHETDRGAFASYTVSYGDLFNNISLEKPLSKKVNTSDSMSTQARIRHLKISSAGLNRVAPGAYSDTLTLMIIAM